MDANSSEYSRDLYKEYSHNMNYVYSLPSETKFILVIITGFLKVMVSRLYQSCINFAQLCINLVSILLNLVFTIIDYIFFSSSAIFSLFSCIFLRNIFIGNNVFHIQTSDFSRIIWFFIVISHNKNFAFRYF